METKKTTKKEDEIVKLPYVSSEEIFNDIKNLANAIESGKKLTVKTNPKIDKLNEECQRYIKRITEVVKQRDDLLAACKVGLSYIKAILSRVPRPIQDLQEDKKQVEQAISQAKPEKAAE